MFDLDDDSTRNNVAWFLMGDFMRLRLWEISLIMVKFLQLRGRRQIAKPCKYCLVHVIIFSLACVFSILFLIGLGISC